MRKGGSVIHIGFMTLLLFAVIAYIYINIMNPEAGAQITESVANLSIAVQGK